MAPIEIALIRFSTSVLRAQCRQEGERYVIESLKVSTAGASASFALEGLQPFIPQELIAGQIGDRRLKTGDELTPDLRAAYAALRARLSNLQFRSDGEFLGLPSTVGAVVELSVILPPMAPLVGSTSDNRTVGLVAKAEIALTTPTVKGRLYFQFAFTGPTPRIRCDFGWPTISLAIPEFDFPKLSLPGLQLRLPPMPGWLPKSSITWNRQPVLQIDVAGGASLRIDDGQTPGQPVSGTLAIDGADLVGIDAFQVSGPIGNLRVTTRFSIAAQSRPLPPGQIPVGPLTIAWQQVSVAAALNGNVLTFTTDVASLKIWGDDQNRPVEIAFALKTDYNFNTGAASHGVQNVQLLQPTGSQLAQILVKELRGLTRIIVPIKLPSVGPPDELLKRIGEMLDKVLRWLSDGAGAIVGLGRSVADLGKRVFDRLGGVGTPNTNLLLEVRWDGAAGRIKQIVLSRAGSDIPASEISVGELKVNFPGAGSPLLIYDLVDRWAAIAVAPAAGTFAATLSTDLWFSGKAGSSAARGTDADPLIKITATVRAPAGGQTRAPVALALLQDGQARFFQSLGSGPADQLPGLGGAVSIGAPFVPGPMPLDLDLNVEFNRNKFAAIFPTGSGNGSGRAPTVKLLAWRQTSVSGSKRDYKLDLEVDPRLGGAPLRPTVKASLDLRSFTLRLEGADIPIDLPSGVDVLGARLSVVPPIGGLVLRLSDAPSLRLAPDARALLHFDQVGSGEESLGFEAVGETGFALGTAGLDLDAHVIDHPIRLRGMDTPFRFTSGGVRIERGRLLSAAIVGSGALPPALLGDAKIDVGIQIGQDASSTKLVVQSATARLERAGEPLVCEGTRFHFELTHVGLGFKLIDGNAHFYGELTGSAAFRPNPGELGGGLLARLPEVRINLDRAPIAGDGRALARAINFQVPIEPPARTSLFNLFDFELRGVGFHPSFGGWKDNPPALSLSGQVRFTDAFDVVQPSFEFHKMWITLPESGKTLPRVRMDGLGVGLRIGAMGEFEASAVAVDGSLPSLYAPDVLPANVTAHGFLASGRLMLKGWAAMAGAAGFLELERADKPGKRRLTFFVYAQQERLAEPIPTPIGTIYLREVGFGLGYRFTLASLAQTDTVTDPRSLIQILDPLSKRQGDLASFPAWQPEISGDRVTLAMRALFTVTTASSPTVYNAAKEKDLDNPILFDVVAALRSDLTFLLSARGWVAVNYADWLTGQKDWRERPLLRGYVYISAPKKTFLGRLLSDPKGHVGEHPKLPDPLKQALTNVQFSSTLYITPGLFHHELGWPYELKLDLGEPKDDFYASLTGGMVVRIEDGAILHGLAFAARGHARIGGRVGGSIGASAQAVVTFAIDSKFIAFVSVARPAESLFYGRMRLALSVKFSISFWVDLRFFSASASWSERIDLEIDLELAVGPRGLGGHARASLSLRRFGRGLRLGVSLGFNQGMLGNARARVERFMTLGLGATVPDPATGLAPLPEPARKPRAEAGDEALSDLALRRETIPLPPENAATPPIEPPVPGKPITGCEFWAILIPIRGSSRAILQLVPRDTTTRVRAKPFGNHPHGDFFVSPHSVPSDGHLKTGHHYIFAEAPAGSGALARLGIEPGDPIKRPDWAAVVDLKSDATLGDLVSTGFLSPASQSGPFTQPDEELPDTATVKAKADTVGCIEARGGLIGLVCDRAKQLAEAGGTAMPAGEINPRWFGLTFEIDADEDSLRALFPIGQEPRKAAFTIAKSDDLSAGGPTASTVELFNPPERMFENAQPRLAGATALFKDEAIRLAWDLEPSWGASEDHYGDPESHLLHYAVQRHIRVDDDMGRRYAATWLSKPGNIIDLAGVEQDRDFQVLDTLESLPDDLRKALVYFQAHNPHVDLSKDQSRDYAKLRGIWESYFPNAKKIRFVYSVVAIDNAGTRADPSPPIELVMDAPAAPRTAPLTSVGIDFNYVPLAAAFDFPRADTTLPATLSVFLSRSDLTAPGAKPEDPVAVPDIELYFDSNDDERSGIYGADLLDAERHFKRRIAPTQAATGKLTSTSSGGKTLPVKVQVVDPDQPNWTQEPSSFFCPATLIRQLAGQPQRATRIFARRAAAAGDVAAQWTLCDLKLRIARKPEGGAKPPQGIQPNDFIAPAAEFELPRIGDPRLLGLASISAEQGLLHRQVPRPDAMWGDFRPDLTLCPDPENRSAVRLSWLARPATFCDGSAARPDLIGGFDLFVGSRDREPPKPGAPDTAELARLARPLGRVLVKPRALLRSEPALIEDFSKLEVAYPSETRRTQAEGWFSAAESRLIWPERTPRRALMLVPDEGLIGEMFGHGRPSEIELRLLETRIDAAGKKNVIPGRLALVPVEGGTPAGTLVRLPDQGDDLAGKGWHAVGLAGVKPSTIRLLLQQLNRLDEAAVPVSGTFEIKYKAGGLERSATIEIALASELHPVLADVIDLLRYEMGEFKTGTGYRRYEPVLEGAPAPQAGTPSSGTEPVATDRPLAAQLLSDTASERDKGGWAALRQLGLAAGLRVWDTEAADWIDLSNVKGQLRWAWDHALARNRTESWKFGAPFIEQFFDPEELYVLGGEDRVHRPRHGVPEGMPLMQISLRPITDRLALGRRPGDEARIHYVRIDLSGPALLKASDLTARFGRGAFVQFAASGQGANGSEAMWVGENLDAQGEPLAPDTAFAPRAEYKLEPKASGEMLLARIVLLGTRRTPDDAAARLALCLGNNARISQIPWTPADGGRLPEPNPYRRFDPLPLTLTECIERQAVENDGHVRLRALASARYGGWTGTLDEIGAIRRWERRFFEHGVGQRQMDRHAIGFATATIDAPAALRRGPDERGRLSVLYVDNSRLGSWRRFYVRPFGRYDHLAEASGWPVADDKRLVESDFGGAIAGEPWVDVTLARTRDVARPVLLASAYATDARALVAVVAHSDEEILANANLPQAGARQIGMSDIGWDYELGAGARSWAAMLLPGTSERPTLKARLLPPRDTAAFVEWLTRRATPPEKLRTAKGEQEPVSQPALPDVWRGATAVAAYDLPYFFDYHLLLANGAGAAISPQLRAAMPAPQPNAQIDWQAEPRQRVLADGKIEIILPLPRYLDCMETGSRDAWYDPGDTASAALFELPDPSLIYRFSLRSSEGDVRSPEFDVEANPATGGYTLAFAGRNFRQVSIDPPVKTNRNWSLRFVLSSTGTGIAGSPILEVVPIRNLDQMAPMIVESV